MTRIIKEKTTETPLKYKTIEELESAISDYFRECKAEFLTDGDGSLILDKYNRPVKLSDKPQSLAGLALSLGFSTKKALLDYKGKAPFKHAVLSAILRCEAYAESRLYDRDGARGAELVLRNNFRWQSDLTEKENSGGLIPFIVEYINERNNERDDENNTDSQL